MTSWNAINGFVLFQVVLNWFVCMWHGAHGCFNLVTVDHCLYMMRNYINVSVVCVHVCVRVCMCVCVHVRVCMRMWYGARCCFNLVTLDHCTR